MTSAAGFYDTLAPWYHLVYEDWQAAIERQGAQLESVIRSALGDGRRTVLDVACGIGTQSLGLALRGFELTGSDISAAAVERARREASQRGLSIGLSVADMRRAHAHHAREFDVVLCADNALPHLLSDGDIAIALREFFLCTRLGGVTILSVRDYSRVERGGTQVSPMACGPTDPRAACWCRCGTGASPLYDLSFYVIRDDGKPHVMLKWRARRITPYRFPRSWRSWSKRVSSTCGASTMPTSSRSSSEAGPMPEGNHA